MTHLRFQKIIISSRVPLQINKEDLFAILGIAKNSSVAQIKKAYHQKAMKYHPNSPEVINLILNDPQKKAYFESEFNKIHQAYLQLMAAHNQVIKETPALEFIHAIEFQPKSDDVFEEKQIQSKNFEIKILDEKNFENFNLDIKLVQPASPYTNNFYHLDNDSILAEVKQGEEHYQFLPESKTFNYSDLPKSFIWKAEKENSPTLYIFNSLHETSFDIEDFFGDVLNHLLSHVNCVYTEVSMELDSHRKTRGLDDWIANKAAVRGKELKALEDIRILHLLDKDLPKHKPGQIDVKALSHKYLTHVYPSFISSHAGFLEEMRKRNIFWMINSILAETTPALIVHGAAHCVGKYGTLNLLAQEGYTLTPLMTCVRSNKKVLRGLFYRSPLKMLEIPPSESVQHQLLVTR